MYICSSLFHPKKARHIERKIEKQYREIMFITSLKTKNHLSIVLNKYRVNQ